jgi:hypothetical protein
MLPGRLFKLFSFFLLFGSAASAALVVESSDQEGEKAPIPSRMIMDTAGLRAESSDGTFIFRPDQQVLWILNSAGKEYRQITESDLGEMNSQMNDAMKKMEKQLAQMPPDQRLMVEEILKKQIPGGMPGTDRKKPKSTFEKVAEGEKIGEWICDKYVEKEEGVKVGEVWTVPAVTFLSFAKYFKMLVKLGSFFNKLPMAQEKVFDFPMLKASDGDEESGLSGIPVKDVRFQTDGTVSSRWELKSIKEEPVDALLFELPKDYKHIPLTKDAH